MKVASCSAEVTEVKCPAPDTETGRGGRRSTGAGGCAVRWVALVASPVSGTGEC